MWKWIAGIALLVVALLVWRVATAVKALSAGGDSTTTMIMSTPDRVFATLADPDSMPLWMTGETVQSSRHGMLQVGDTVRVQPARSSSPRAQVTWVVREVSPGKLLALQLQNDSSGRAITTQRDSLVGIGDSTMLITTIAVPIMDSIRSNRGDSGSRAGSAMIDFGSKMMIGAFRKISEMERAGLKAHLEAKPVTPPH